MKKIVSALLSILVLGVMLTQNACRHKKIGLTFYVPLIFKKAATIKDGSYFIYKDSTDGILDSFYSESYHDVLFGQDGVTSYVDPNSYEQITYSLVDTFDNNLHFEAYNGGRGGSTFGFQFSGYIFGKGQAITLPFYNDSTYILRITSNGDTMILSTIALHPELIVGQHSYTQVYEQLNSYHFLNGASTSYMHTFYSVDSGLVKFRYKKDGEDWHVYELVKNKIIR